jgi:hypothetical protein
VLGSAGLFRQVRASFALIAFPRFPNLRFRASLARQEHLIDPRIVQVFARAVQADNLVQGFYRMAAYDVLQKLPIVLSGKLLSAYNNI